MFTLGAGSVRCVRTFDFTYALMAISEPVTLPCLQGGLQYRIENCAEINKERRSVTLSSILLAVHEPVQCPTADRGGSNAPEE